MLTAEEAAQMLRITYPTEASEGFVPFHRKIEDLLVNDVKPLTIRELQKRLADRGTAATLTEVERAVRYRREIFVNIRRNGFILKNVYDALPRKWFETTDDILKAAEIALRSASEPFDTEQILESLRKQGFDIFGEGAYILRKSMSRSGRFLIVGRQPTLWQLKSVGKRAPQRLSSQVSTSSPIIEAGAVSAVQTAHSKGSNKPSNRALGQFGLRHSAAARWDKERSWPEVAPRRTLA